MSDRLKYYELSKEADLDLEAIFDYSEREHGFDQAVSYLMILESVFNSLVSNPEMGRERIELKEGLFSIIEQEHVIFYRILTNHIRIVRVLHGSRDLPNYF